LKKQVYRLDFGRKTPDRLTTFGRLAASGHFAGCGAAESCRVLPSTPTCSRASARRSRAVWATGEGPKNENAHPKVSISW